MYIETWIPCSDLLRSLGLMIIFFKKFGPRDSIHTWATDEHDPTAATDLDLHTLSPEELAATIGVELPSGAYTTAGGLLMTVAGRIPDEGDVVVIDKAEFMVIQMDRNRVDRIRADIRQTLTESQTDAEERK